MFIKITDTFALDLKDAIAFVLFIIFLFVCITKISKFSFCAAFALLFLIYSFSLPHTLQQKHTRLCSLVERPIEGSEFCCTRNKVLKKKKRKNKGREGYSACGEKNRTLTREWEYLRKDNNFCGRIVNP